MRAIAIIPARGGSKRIPRKNIKDFCGKPILAYSITAAFDSGCFSEVMVSTDDEEIASVARKLNASVPFLRSKKNSTDTAGTVEVILEVLDSYERAGKQFDFVCCIYPTAPFLSGEKLRKGINLLSDQNADAVLPVVRFSYPIQRALKVHDGEVKMFWPENYSARSQDLEPAYHDCGQFYFLNVAALKKQKRLFAEKTIPMIVPASQAQDIDNEEDWKIAEMKFRSLQQD